MQITSISPQEEAFHQIKRYIDSSLLKDQKDFRVLEIGPTPMENKNKREPICSYFNDRESPNQKVGIDRRKQKKTKSFHFMHGDYLHKEVRIRANNTLNGPPNIIIGEMIFEDNLETWMTRGKVKGISESETVPPDSLPQKLFVTALSHLSNQGILVLINAASQVNRFTPPKEIQHIATIPAEGTSICYQDFQVFTKPTSEICEKILKNADCL